MPRKLAKLPKGSSRHLDVSLGGSVRNRRRFRNVSPLDAIFRIHTRSNYCAASSLIYEPKLRLCRRKLRMGCVLSRKIPDPSRIRLRRVEGTRFPTTCGS